MGAQIRCLQRLCGALAASQAGVPAAERVALPPWATELCAAAQEHLERALLAVVGGGDDARKDAKTRADPSVLVRVVFTLGELALVAELKPPPRVVTLVQVSVTRGGGAY